MELWYETKVKLPAQKNCEADVTSVCPSSKRILGFHARDETAMLVNKTMAKCRSRFNNNRI